MPKLTQPKSAPSDLKLVTAAEVIALLRITRSGLQHLRRDDPTFPPAMRLGTSPVANVRWRLADIEAWIEGRFDRKTGAIGDASSRTKAPKTIEAIAR